MPKEIPSVFYRTVKTKFKNLLFGSLRSIANLRDFSKLKVPISQGAMIVSVKNNYFLHYFI